MAEDREVPGYVVAQVQIEDRAGFVEYGKLFGACFPADARVLVTEDEPAVLEGDWPQGRTVVLQFPSVEAAQAWYNSDEYQAASIVRRASSTGRMAIVRGAG